MEDKNRKYFWLKLRDQFFGQLPIIRLRQKAGGAELVIAYLKLQLLSLQSGGWLYFMGIEDDSDIADELATILNEDAEAIRFVLDYCRRIGWLEVTDAGDVHWLALDCGSETEAAARMRELRERRRTEKLDANTEAAALLAGGGQ